MSLVSDDVLLTAPLGELIAQSGAIAAARYGGIITYSPKVFIALTKLCRDYCGYCTFSRDHSGPRDPYLSLDEVTEIALAGAAKNCIEALFTLGDKPELRYPKAAAWLQQHGYSSTADYLLVACRTVIERTGLLPHVNAGVLTREEMIALREVSVSMGLMLEVSAERLLEKGQAHYRSPDKDPAVRVRMLQEAGALNIPVTTGLLVGIGETREERLFTLRQIQQMHEQYGHVQEVIIQNFCPKPGTPMLASPAASLDEQLWTLAAARLILSSDISLQSPPNLRPESLDRLLAAGINDLGGISPVTIDHVNPEAAWPEIQSLDAQLSRHRHSLAARLPVYPAYIEDRGRWIAPALRSRVLQHSDATGLARNDLWNAGAADITPPAFNTTPARRAARSEVSAILAVAEARNRLDERQITALFSARGDDFMAITRAADAMRKAQAGDKVRYVINRNINYTNICSYKCGFCAFSKRTGGHRQTEGPYNLDLAEVVNRAREAWGKGATEVCMQGGIHPSYDGNTYLSLLSAVKSALPDLHVHAFSPLEVHHGATTLGISVSEFLHELKRRGLGSLPGTAAEILCDDIRAIICPDKLNSAEWLHVIGEAHKAGLRTTSTIMFGHVEHPMHWARHLLSIRDLQSETGGITEFVPLPFVHVNSPIYKRGLSRKGPTWRETVLMYSVSRLVLGPLIPNIQTSWVKLGPRGAQLTLDAGANDFGGVLMNESISRAAGAEWGQGLTAGQIEALTTEINRVPEQRTTLYGTVPLRKASLSPKQIPITPIGEPAATACQQH